ncbi:MAG: hypothetical protein A2Y03_03135 [Omnitrophica WOR_2 bacterium GWF2_38_59]|nr:MAG: hypothetical protein A2Y03_03135 [Omnitrophica WOR_2 bacterium GWF2_38_59]OGX49294.1 MAG: hypothetical protein A2243_08770 [Omnitrophica WOR_2 bacterium RIFOXYA2_FULL_38_17]OGX55877.1 MAG: hypothetical protein A2447_04225 [Omnitrophica WOR_2 bacterium RIFOXYC2_FULL_38_12]OGX58218.1 MAG: hypothetical protein A2306_11915 [Omnitrophica WOR_2 bacterium RIFOXYB2_FULL_38_16]HBG61885.1 aspartate dehydrogenase [Candidatus Omnitrophota bacterium]
MKSKKIKLKIGIIGCGAIGSRMAQNIVKDLKDDCKLTSIFDIDASKSAKLKKSLSSKVIIAPTLKDLIKSSDLVVEAVNAINTKDIIKAVVSSKKSVLAMSVGKLLGANNIFKIAKKNKCSILIPSGAIAGLDAIKAAKLAGIKSISITSRKPPRGLVGNPYCLKKGIDLLKINRETLLFNGKVSEAVKAFPQNINVAATVALAADVENLLRIKIITSPKFKTNSHEIIMIGNFGKMISRTENVACPDNPKTSYLAALSALQTLKQYCKGTFIGT